MQFDGTAVHRNDYEGVLQNASLQAEFGHAGSCWRVYKVTFAKPIDQELVIDIDFCSLNPKNAKDIESLYLFCKEGWIKSVLGDYHSQKQALSRFFLGAMVLSDPVLEIIRRELRRVSPDVRIDIEEIKAVLTSEVLKREVMEGDKADQARKKIARAANKALKSKAAAKADDKAEPCVSTPVGEPSDAAASPETEA